MKKIFSILTIAGACLTSAFAQETARLETKSIDSKFFPFEREFFIYTPNYYDEATEADFDVIYVFDSQWRSRFDLVHSLMHYGTQSEDQDNVSYIVVGVPSPHLPEFQYERNRDLLPTPEHIDRPKEYCNSANFKKFLKEELMPYIDSNYRTSGHTLAIGHSLGASFILDALATDDMFDDYMAFSPNMAWDENRFGNELINYNFNNGKPRYIHMTMANENKETGWPEDWRPAWDMVKSHFESATLPDYIKMTITEYPELSHNGSYQPAPINALREYFFYSHSYGAFPTSDELYPVHLEVTRENLDGDVYVTGNQEALADWNPKGIKMNKIADNTYAIDLNLKLPAEFKFTQGTWDWDSQLSLKNGVPGNQRIINPSKADKHYEAFYFPKD